MSTGHESSRIVTPPPGRRFPRAPWGERILRLSWLVPALAVYCSLVAVYVRWGGVNGDEGFYVLAARNVMEGMKPYQDFLLQQMPLLPYAYAAWFRVAGTSIESGRCFSAILGAGAIVLIGLACARRGGRLGGVIGSLLVACNLSFASATGMVRTQALSVFLTAAAVFVLAAEERPSVRRAALAMAFASLAFLGRLSLLPFLVGVWAYVGLRLREQGRHRALAALLSGNMLALAILSFYFWSGGNLLFGVYHLHREYFGFPPWSLQRALVFMRGWIGNQLPILLLLICALWLFVRRQTKPSSAAASRPQVWFLWLLLWSYGATTLIHITNPTSHPGHQTNVVAFPAVFAAVIIAPAVRSLVPEWHQVLGAGFVALLGLAMPFQNWFVSGNGEGSLAKIREAQGLIRQVARSGETLLSFNPELAVNGGYRVPHGYELGQFSYFPTMSDARCARLRATNYRKLVADVTSRVGRVLCIGDQEFKIMTGGNQQREAALGASIDEHYRLVGTVSGYGQFFERLHIFAARR